MGEPQITSDAIRQFANRHYVEPARLRNETSVTITIGDFHDQLKLRGRAPQVCSALSAAAFETHYRVRQTRRDGPEQGRTTKFTFAILP
jgi:hypothetical protein